MGRRSYPRADEVVASMVDELLARRRDRAWGLWHLQQALLKQQGVGISCGHLRALVDARPERYQRVSQCVVLIASPADGSAPAAPPCPPPPEDPAGTPPDQHYCGLCRVRCYCQQEWDHHCTTRRHRIKQVVQHHSSQASGAAAPPTGLVVSELQLDACCELGGALQQTLKVHNGAAREVTLRSFILLRRAAGVTVWDAAGNTTPGRSITLRRGVSAYLTVEVCTTAYGIVNDVLLLDFGTFSIVRPIRVRCDPELPAGLDLRPVAPYQPKPRRKLEPITAEIVPGEPPPRSQHKWERHPGRHPPPTSLRQALSSGDRMQDVQDQLAAVPRTLAEFCAKLQLLQWLEQLQHEIDVRQYDTKAVLRVPQASRRLFYLAVPGLAENRPSVMRGDVLFVSYADGSHAGKQYEGHVHHVGRDEVALMFHADFHASYVAGHEINVRFSICTSTFNFMQSAVSRGAAALHPSTVLGYTCGLAPLPPPPSPTLMTRLLSLAGGAVASPRSIATEPTWTRADLNPEQKEAVRSILRGAHAPLPFLVFGPPGTGKTMTAMEAAVQTFKLDPGSRLLLVAPSNSAADLLAVKALEKGVPASQLLRVCAYSRVASELPLELRRDGVTNQVKEGFELPSKQEVLAKRVVAVTCLMAGKLYAMGVPSAHFTHVFLDEAGHAEEPLTLAALAGLLAGDTTARLVMAGDPQQLGPVILSSLAQRYGLATSAMERLIHSEPYARREREPHYDPRFICKLLVNYRSHPAILRLPNASFYMNELREGADRYVTHSLVGQLGFRGLPPSLSRANKDFPIVFHAIVGEDMREGNSPSWFNVSEVALVGQYVRHLLDMRANRPSLQDIGVISPYRTQVHKIRKVTGASSELIKVGSVEEFQGQERRVIIISTVRSSVDLLDFDSKHRLGFLKNPKRFNVALTRAKALVIVIGNPAVLAHDPHWASLLTYVHRSGGWVGSEPPQEILSASAASGPAGSPAEDAWFRGLTQLSPAAEASVRVVSVLQPPLAAGRGQGSSGPGVGAGSGSGAAANGFRGEFETGAALEGERELSEALRRLDIGGGGRAAAAVMEEAGGDAWGPSLAHGMEGGELPRRH